MRRHEVTEELIADAARRVVELGWCKPGQRVGITAGPAERQAGHDEPVPGPAALGASRRGAGAHAERPRRRAAIDARSTTTATIASGEPRSPQRAAERGVGEGARGARRSPSRRRTSAARIGRQAGGVVDEAVRHAGRDPRVEDAEEAAAPDPRAQRAAAAGRRARSTASCAHQRDEARRRASRRASPTTIETGVPSAVPKSRPLAPASSGPGKSATVRHARDRR